MGIASDRWFGWCGAARLVVLVVACPWTASAQFRLESHFGPAQNSDFGRKVFAAGDLNSDGTPDYYVNATNGSGLSHPIYSAFSGADGSLLYGMAFPSAPGGFGLFWTGTGSDYTGDGIPDLMTGIPGGTTPPAPGLPISTNGTLYIFSGLDGSFSRAVHGNGVAYFSQTAHVLPDLTGDGRAEYAVGCNVSASASALSLVQVLSGATDSVLYTLMGQQSGDLFGDEVHSIDDFDGDTVPEIVVGAPLASTKGLSHNGTVRIFSGATGQELRVIHGAASAAVAGGQIVGLSRTSMPAGSRFAYRAQNKIRVVDAATGAEVTAPMTSPSGVPYGIVLRSCDDLDGDGWSDLLISDRNGPAPTKGGVDVMSSGSGTRLFRLDNPYSAPWLSDYPEDIAVIGDVTGDGISEWVVSDSGIQEAVTLNRGAAEVWSIQSLIGDRSALTQSGSVLGLHLSAGYEFAGASYYTLASYTGHTGISTWGTTIPLTYDPLTELSILFANTSYFNATFGALDPSGRATCSFDGSLLPPAADGLTFSFATLVLRSDGKAMATVAFDVVIELN